MRLALDIGGTTITVSTGIGAGLIVNGDLVTGATGLAGHVGFWRD